MISSTSNKPFPGCHLVSLTLKQPAEVKPDPNPAEVKPDPNPAEVKPGSLLFFAETDKTNSQKKSGKKVRARKSWTLGKNTIKKTQNQITTIL